MVNTYQTSPPKGTFTFSPDTFKTADFTALSDTGVNEDTYNTVAKLDLRDGLAAALGRGESSIPEYAEAFIYADVRSSNDADADGTKDKLAGRGKLVVLNANNTKVDTIWSGRLSELRQGANDRSSRKPFPRQYAARQGTSEVYGNDYSIGLQIEIDSGTDDFSLSASSWDIEGYHGEKVN